MKKKKRFSTVILIVVLLIGLSLLLYPTVSDGWNSIHQSKIIDEYSHIVTGISEQNYESFWTEAQDYNQTLPGRDNPFVLSDSQMEEYESVLDISGDGMMAYIQIPKIDCILPIYHGVDEAVLQVAVGHIPGSSLPVGGESTHCVISGHRGLPSSRLFTDLDELTEGDMFFIHVLNETLTYEVDQILIVEPQEIEPLKIQPGEDYCTLVTCTPYGINSHRLLVRGHRIPNPDEADIRLSADARQIDPDIVAPILAVPLLVIFIVIVFVKFRKRGKTS